MFRGFGLQHTFQERIAPKWLEIDQDNLRMKFLALNVDFSSLSPGPYVERGLRTRRAGVKYRCTP